MDKGYYSFVVTSPRVVVFHQFLLVLDEGRNVFCQAVDSLEDFTSALKEAGVEVNTVNRLDDFDYQGMEGYAPKALS